MVDFVTQAGRSRGRYTYLLQIDGVGTYDGLYTWSLTIPDYAVGNALYTGLDTLAGLPRPTPERTENPLGGMPESGSITVRLVDVADRITSAIRTRRGPATHLAADITATATTITVRNGAGLPSSNFLIHVGRETIRISSRSGDTLTVATGGRGALNTYAATAGVGSIHRDRAAVYLSPPYLKSRRMQLYLASLDATDEAEALEYRVGSYRIDRAPLVDRLCTWELSGTTETFELSRQINSALPGGMRIIASNGLGQLQWTYVPSSRGGATVGSLAAILIAWPDDRAWWRVADTGEVVLTTGGRTSALMPVLVARGQANTAEDDIPPGSVLEPVLVSDEVYGSFRVSPGPTPSTSRSSGTWNVSTNLVDHLLCMLTSSARLGDGLELTNYTAGEDNWSSLPPGFGIGFPAARIDFGTFAAVRNRTRNMTFPALVVGGKAETYAEWATRTYLEPLGLYLCTIAGRLSLVYPRLLLAGEATDADLTLEDILEMGDPEPAMDLAAGSVAYSFGGTNGARHERVFSSADFGDLFDRTEYAPEDAPERIELPAVRAGQNGLEGFLLLIAARRLYRSVEPPIRIPITVGAQHHALSVGSIVSVTHPDLVDLATGERGWTSVLGQVVEAPPVTLDPRHGASRKLAVLFYPGTRVGRVAPSAVIRTVTGAGPWTVGVEANRYTDADEAAALGLPVDDAAGFEAGDYVKTIDRSGVTVTTGLRVSAVAAAELEITGSTAPAVGDLVVFDDYAAAGTTQRARFAAWADDQGEIASGVAGWRFGEG